mmetsp:Transcript_50775/g.162560  ORF Transcript_50775/g.162560 Transcript_50775/m.162560 type:complete len:116 (+) Transcript_50775:2-349(+)
MAPPGSPVVGVGCSSSLVTASPKKGVHECRVAARSSRGVSHLQVQLAKGQRDRWEEDDVASRLIIKVLAEHCGVDASELPLHLLGGLDRDGEEEEVLTQHTQDAAPALDELLECE